MTKLSLINRYLSGENITTAFPDIAELATPVRKQSNIRRLCQIRDSIIRQGEIWLSEGNFVEEGYLERIELQTHEATI